MPVNFKGFTFWLVSDGAPIGEYNVQVEDNTTISCYIPSETGKEFTICWTDEGDPSRSVVAFHMDGRAVGGKPSVRGTMGWNEGVLVSPNKLRPFVFGNIITTDDDDIASPDGADPDLGCIQIEILRVRSIRKERERAAVTQVHDVGPVHERSKKLGAHVVGLGQEKDQRHGEFFAPTFTNDGPYAVFRFMYRPREMLMARGIMPLPGADVVDEKKPIIAEAEAGPSNPATRSRTRSGAATLVPAKAQAKKPKSPSARQKRRARLAAKAAKATVDKVIKSEVKTEAP